MKNYLKQDQRQHGCRLKNGGARLFSLFLLTLLTMTLLPSHVAAQDLYTGAVAEYEQATKTLTLKYLDNEALSDNMYKIDGALNNSIDNNDIKEGIESIVIEESFKSYKPTSLDGLFFNLSTVKSIKGLGNIDTEQVTSMDNMFGYCAGLKEFDIDKLNTTNVESMMHMFYGCASLETLDLSNFNTKKLTSLQYIFSYCTNLKSVLFPDTYLYQDGKNYQVYGWRSNCTATFYVSPNEFNNSIFPLSIKKIYVKINPNAEYGTLCVPIDGDLTETFSGFDKLYTIKEYKTDENKIMLEEATSITAGVPYIYHRNLTASAPIANAITYSWGEGDADTPNNDGFLKGTFEATTAPLGSYVLQTDGMFHPVRSNTIKVGAYRAYLELPGLDNTGGVEEAKNFLMVFEDDVVNGVNGVYDHVGSMAPTVYYDLMGRKVSSPAKGQVYIVNGKKVRF